MSLIFQDWTVLEGPSGAGEIFQSSALWLKADAYRDIFFWLEVQTAIATSTIEHKMDYQTAPTFDHGLFRSMVTAFPLTDALGTPKLTPVLLSQSTDPLTAPLASYVRWRLRTECNSAWKVAFRIHAYLRR